MTVGCSVDLNKGSASVGSRRTGEIVDLKLCSPVGTKLTVWTRGADGPVQSLAPDLESVKLSWDTSSSKSNLNYLDLSIV